MPSYMWLKHNFRKWLLPPSILHRVYPDVFYFILFLFLVFKCWLQLTGLISWHTYGSWLLVCKTFYCMAWPLPSSLTFSLPPPAPLADFPPLYLCLGLALDSHVHSCLRPFFASVHLPGHWFPGQRPHCSLPISTGVLLECFLIRDFLWLCPSLHPPILNPT